MTADVLFEGLYWLHCLVAGGLMLYGLNYYVLLATQQRFAVQMLPHDAALEREVPQTWPRVTVQLPIYNEQYVLRRLVEAVVCLDYPREQLDIQILDDSTDATTSLAARLVRQYRQQGCPITLVHRQHRHGYKAGALQEGLALARGEFIAIFDADFVPPADFLRRLLPFFTDTRVGMVQSRWGHINRTYSLLSLAQSIGIDGHFWVEQAARCWAGWFMNFNGSGGIWRRRTIEDVGGWQADTLTEDLDLSYRAQLRGWRCKFVPQVVCPAELPVQMSGVKSQQHRWAKGSIQTALKLLPRLLRAPLPLLTKVQGVYHLTNYLVHPLMLGLALTTPVLLQGGALFTAPMSLLTCVAIAGATCAPSSVYLYTQHRLYPGWYRRPWGFLALLVLGTGIALSNTRAVLEAVFQVQSPFVRTPKFRIEQGSDTWRGKHYNAPFNAPFPWLSLGEVTLGLYSASGLLLAWQRGVYGVLPFQLLYTLGFLSVAGLSLWEYGQRYHMTLLPQPEAVRPSAAVEDNGHHAQPTPAPPAGLSPQPAAYGKPPAGRSS
ncbi:MAG: cellulose synthase family protein [Candidatus Tectimicrobiota bacterium]